MLKKSLKMGSIIVLLVSLFFFIGCSNGSTDTEEENTGGNGGGGVQEDKVTKVTIDQGNVEVPRNSTYTFTAKVEGIGKYSQDVTWTLLNPDEDEPAFLPGTKLVKGRLTVDLGENTGRKMRIQAASVDDPTVKSEVVEATVAPTGPYFTWEPSYVEVEIAATSQDVASGYLRGYSREDIDIRIRAGVLEEGVDYTIAPENLVGDRGSIIVTGSDKHFDEVVISIANSTLIRLVDPTKKGLIKINLEQAALFGSDKDLVQANRHTLTLEVVDGRVIPFLTGTEMNWINKGATPPIIKPTQGDNIPVDLTITGTPGYSLKSLKWDTKTYNNLFYKVKDTPVKATVELQATTGKYFLGSIGPSDIQNATSFVNGAPEVSDISVSEDGKTLQFVLSYDVFALKLIPGTSVGGVSQQLVLATYLTKDLFAAGKPLHRDALPPAEVLLNTYFEVEGSVDKVWSGSVDTEKSEFVGVKGTPMAQATATITLLPKVGYTFDGTTFAVTDFVGSSKPFNLGNRAGDGTLTTGPEGSLILTIVYNIDEKPIPADGLSPDYFTRIARPLHNKSVRVGTPGAVETAFIATEDSPYTGTVSWTAGSGPRVNGRFDSNDLQNPVKAIVKLTPKPGYKFIPTANTYAAADLSSAVAVDAVAATGGNFAAGAGGYDLNFEIAYDKTTTPPAVLQQIRNLAGLKFTDIDPTVGGTPAATTYTSETGAPIATGGDIFFLGGLDAADKFQFNTPATFRFVLEPENGYSFAADDGPDPYLTYGETLDEAGTAVKKLIEDHFSQVYKGTKLAAGARVKSSTEYRPYLDAAGNLVLTLTYPAKPEQIKTATDFAFAEIGDFPDPTVSATPARPTRLTGVNSTKYTASDIVWTTDDTADAGKFVVGKKYTATITLTPKSGYTFIGLTSAEVEGIDVALDDSTNGTWRTAANHNIKVAADTDLTVTGVTVGADEDPVDPTKDKLVIKITFTITT